MKIIGNVVTTKERDNLHHITFSGKFWHHQSELCWIGTELRDPPVFDGTTSVGDFLEFKAPEEQRVLALDVALKGTSARWWAIHKENLTTWEKFSLP